MKPINFPQMNCTYAKDQKQYRTLPAYRDQAGNVTSCWKASLAERIFFLFTGRLWLSQLTFGTRLQPQRPTIICPIKDVAV